MKNVILVTIDTLRRDVFGCYGQHRSYTPFMDSLMNRCIRFDRAYATGPYTQASFPGILTSTYYLEYGRQKNLPEQKKIISEVLKSKGVETAAFHSNPYLSAYFGWNRGWDAFYDSMDDDVTDYYPFIRGNGINSKVDAWISEREDENRPFFLWVHYMDVHEPYVPEEEYLHRIDPELRMDKKEMFRLFKEVILKRDVSDGGRVSLLQKLYHAKVLEVDEYVSGLFEIFGRSGALEKSTVILGSDHGDEFNEHGGLSHDGKMYGELVAVPLFIFDQERPSGEVYGSPVSNIDIAPTIAAIMEAGDIEGFRGKSLLPLEGYHRDTCCGEAVNKRGHKEKEEDRPIYYLLRENLKVIFDTDTDGWELYDIAEDPRERTNRIDIDDAARDMKSALVDWLQKRGAGR